VYSIYLYITVQMWCVLALRLPSVFLERKNEMGELNNTGFVVMLDIL